jgi:uncharacterized protein YbaR (Trm112 family)
MTRLCCPTCKLRFTPAVAAFLASCPRCQEPLTAVEDGQAALGFRLFSGEIGARRAALDGAATAPLQPREPVMGDWNIRLLQAAIRRAREQARGRPLQDS